jgi:signal transduction histidine kinase
MSPSVRIRIEEPDGGGVDLTVDDNGPGFPDDLLPLSFDRFNRRTLARTRGGGTDLGGAVVRIHLANGA